MGGGAHEIVVADSGSSDCTLALARRLAEERDGRRDGEPARPPVRLVPPVRLLPAPAGGLPHRAAACNRGAAAASGDVLLFLDADCRLPAGWADSVARALADPAVVGGAFHLHLDGPEPALRRVEWVNRLRYRSSHLFYGDQGVFVRAAAFHAAGGFPEIPVLESARLCKALKRHGRLALVDHRVSASPRRFHDGGIGRVFRADLLLWARGLLRLGPGRAGREYWRENWRRGTG